MFSGGVCPQAAGSPAPQQGLYLCRVNDASLQQILDLVIHSIVAHVEGLAGKLLYNDFALHASIGGDQATGCLQWQACNRSWVVHITCARGRDIIGAVPAACTRGVAITLQPAELRAGTAKQA